MKTDLGRVRGLGSAKEGARHWWAQRLTAIALIPLTIWFAFSIANLADANYSVAAEWLASPFVAIFMIIFVVAMLYHALLGVQVVVEDYINHEGWKFTILIGSKFLFVILGVTAAFSILKLAL